MSSLLDGIDIADKSQKQPASGPSPRAIKVAVASVMLALAGVFIGMQTGLIPSPFGGGQVRNAQGEVVPTPDVRTTSAEIERLRDDEQAFIAKGGFVGDS